MRQARVVSLLTLVAAVATACAAPRATERSSAGEAVSAAPNRPLVVITHVEPVSLAIRGFAPAGGASYPHLILNATFDDVDESGTFYPVLAEALPQLGTDTWRVSSDGSMETVHRLRAGAVWHDGTPLEASDFVFSWQVYANPASGSATTTPLGQMREIVAPDSRTVVIRWKVPYPDAGALYSRTQSGFGALPRHLLEEAYAQGNYDSFANHPFWTTGYVGLGPYRLERWDPGVEIDGVAFDQFVLGRPKIDRVRVLHMTDSAAALASLLSGDAHLALDYMLQYPDGAVLKEQWAVNKRGTVLFSPVLYWCAVIQFRDDQISPPAVRDVRFRRALVHGMDKQALNDALFGGTGVVTYGQLSPRAPYYLSIEPAITKYAYDARRAQQLVEEVGMQRGSDGFYAGPDKQPFTLEVVGRQNPTWESENAIVVEGYRRIGLNAEGRILAATLANQGETRATFKALQLTGSSGFERGMGRMASTAISRPETRWQGSNYGGWSNSEYDRLWDLYNATLDVSTGIKLLADMEKLQSEEVPQIPMYYQPIVTPFTAGLVGPKLRDAGGADTTTRIWEWQWAS